MVMSVKDFLNSGLDKLNTAGKDSKTKTENDKAKEAGAKIVNQKAPVKSSFSVPERIWNFLCNEKSIGSITTAAIMGNIAQESSYNPKADSTAFDGNGSVGICQWTNYPVNGPTGRKTDLKNFAAQKNKDPGDLEVQLEFLWYDIGRRGDMNTTKNASKSMPEENKDQIYAKIKTETKAFCDCFERPQKGYENYENRYNRAIEAYEKQGKGILAAGTYVPENSPANGFVGQSSAAKRGVLIEEIAIEKTGHRDEFILKPQDPDKTFCEPIYPDLTSIGEEIPAYQIPNNIPTSEMKPVDYNTAGAGLVFELSTSAILKLNDDKNLAAFKIKNEAIANQRKEIFNSAKHRAAFKTPSAGKPPNNKDPFPVDYKVVELETHQPQCKINSVKVCRHSMEVGKALVLLSTDTEKRLVRIENNMATMMRYLYRMASRVNINCIYYGGQTSATMPATTKYACIRCLKDNRIEEGKQVTLDQCLNCTRYEPLIGQVYDILSDTGDNLSIILDDNQMSYTTMDEYYKFRNITERQQPMESAKLDATNVKTRNTSEIDLDDEWGPGLAMDWALYPVEMQKPHTNPPVDGSLASSYGANGGAAITNGGVVANMLIEARNQIDASDSKAKKEGSSYAETHTGSVVSEVKASLGSQIREYYKSKGITTGQDQCLIASLMSVYGSQVGDTIDKLEKVKSEIKGKGVDNIVLHVMFYSMDQKYLFGDENKDKLPKRLDEVQKTVTGNVPTGEKETDGSDKTEEKSDSANVMPDGAWTNVNKWNWNEISTPLTINITGKEDSNDLPNQLINFAKVVYLYKELLAKCSASRFDTAEWGFPFTEEQIASAAIGLNHPANGEFNNFRGDHYHNGVDIGVFGGSWSKRHPEGSESKLMRQPVHAVRDGIVSWMYHNGDAGAGGGGNCCGIQHDNGYSSCYMHLASFAVQLNQKVARGEVIGYTGGSGGSTLIDYDEHLHFEIRPDGSHTGIDPWSVYNGNLTSRPRPFQFRDINP